MDEKPWLSKNLLVRLRWWAFKFCGKGEQENLASDVMSEAVSRIEKLEAALRHYVCCCVAPNCEVASLDSCICGLAARRALEGNPEKSVYKEGYRAVEEAMGHPSPEFWVGDRND